jgi:hypothetical protein
VQVGGAAVAGPAVAAMRATARMSNRRWRIASLLSLLPPAYACCQAA